MNDLIVDKLYNDFDELVTFLDSSDEPSFKSLADENFKKTLLLSSASFFETSLTNQLITYFENKTQKNSELKEFLVNKAITRQYHTYFDWNSNNANTFFSLFGIEFKSFMTEKLKSNEEMKKSILDFIEIGRERNRLVHQNYGSFSIEKTAKEIFDLYNSAKKFVNSFTLMLEEFNNKKKNN